MSARPAYVIALAVVAAAGWLAIQTGRGFTPPSRLPAHPAVADSPFDPVVRGIQTQSTRLRAFVESAPPLARPARDPFRFYEPAAAPRPARVPALSTASAMAAASRPGMTLAGIAEDPSPKGPVRTAIIAALGQLFVVKEGETVARRFRVVRIGADTTELSDLTDGTTVTLSMK